MSLFSSDIDTAVKEIELIVDQASATPVTTNFKTKKSALIDFSKTITSAAILIGKIQYPNAHTHWKNEICPPSSFEFNVTMKAPPHIITKIMPKDFDVVVTPRFRVLYKGN